MLYYLSEYRAARESRRRERDEQIKRNVQIIINLKLLEMEMRNGR